MITLYTWKTPNGRKVPIMLEELGWEYELAPVDLSKNEQMDADFLRISPNNKIPALVDEDDDSRVAMFESGSILTYLAEKSGRFLPASGQSRFTVLQWLYWQVGGLGPMAGQLGHFGMMASEKLPTAIERFQKEVDRLLGVMDARLADAEYLGGDYSIADMSAYPWVSAMADMMTPLLGESFATKPAIARWLDALGARPAVQRGMAILES